MAIFIRLVVLHLNVISDVVAKFIPKNRINFHHLHESYRKLCSRPIRYIFKAFSIRTVPNGGVSQKYSSAKLYGSAAADIL